MHNPLTPEELRSYIRLLLERGFDPEGVGVMVKENSERLLGRAKIENVPNRTD